MAVIIIATGKIGPFFWQCMSMESCAMLENLFYIIMQPTMVDIYMGLIVRYTTFYGIIKYFVFANSTTQQD